MKKKILILTLLALVAAVLLGLVVGNPVDACRRYQLKSSIQSLEKQTVTLEAAVPFSWDRVYTFPPYTSQAQMEEALGFASPKLRETVNEGMVQLIFIKDEEVVLCVVGYAENLGYDVELHSSVTNGEGRIFTVERKNGLVYLREQ